MGFSWFLFLSILFIFSSDPILSSSDLIQETCKSTNYYDLCVSSLQSDSSSTKADAKELALVMVRLGIANATATNSYLLKRIREAGDGGNETSAVMQKAMKECADKYGYANTALRNSVQVLSVEMYDYAYLHVMAAGDYPNACRHAFRRMVYPAELAVREDGLKHICDVALGIINSIDW